MGLKRDNHFLSRMYLNAWKNEKGKVNVAELLVPSKKVPYWKEKYISSICKYDSMFVRLKNGVEVDDIEDWFNTKYETPAKPALEHAINDERISIDEWHCLIDFLACHIVRSPAFIIKILDLAKKDCVPIFEEKCEEISSISKDEFIKTINNQKAEVTNDLFPIKITDVGKCDNDNELFKIETIFGKQFYLWIMMHMLKNTSKVLHNHKWGIITVDDKVTLPTSDDPVICLNYNNKNEYDFGGGWGKKNCNILFPISPKKILYTQVGVKVKPRWNVDYKTSVMLKKMIVEHSFRKIISNFEDDEIKSLKPRFVDDSEFKRELQMWKDFQENYIKKEIEYIK